MNKSPTQEKLEAQRHQDIRDIVTGTLAKYRGQRNQMMLVAVDLEVSDATVTDGARSWASTSTSIGGRLRGISGKGIQG